MPTPGPPSSDRDDPLALRRLSRRSLLKGLAGAGGLTVASRLLGPAAAYASPAAGTLSTATTTVPPVLPLPIQADGRVLHGVWLPNGPGSSNAGTAPNYATYIGTGLGGSGHKPAIINFFRAWSTDVANYTTNPATMFTTAQNRLQAITDADAIPMLTWEPWDPTKGVLQPAYSLTNISAGNYDSMIKAFAQGCANWGSPLILRLAHEMNTKTYPWGPGNTSGSNLADGSDYKGFWGHVRAIFVAAGASNVSWAWVPNIDYSGTIAIDSGAQYPGHDLVDWVGLDGYNGYHSYTYDINTHVDTWSDYPALLDLSIDKLVRVTQSTKPIMIAETGCPDTTVAYKYRLNDGTFKSDFPLETATYPTHSKKQWFTDFYSYAADDSRIDDSVILKRNTAQRNVRAVCYFNETDENTTVPPKASNWSLYKTTTDPNFTTQQCQLGYQTGMKLAAMGHGWGDGATPTAQRVRTLLLDGSGVTTGTKVNTLAAWSSSSDLATITKPSATDWYASIPCQIPSSTAPTTPRYAVISTPVSTPAVPKTPVLYRLSGDGIYFKVRGLPRYGTTMFRLIDGANGTNELNFTATPNGSGGVVLTCNYRLGTSTDTLVLNSKTPLIINAQGVFDSTYTWWRIREAAGFIFWETCADTGAALTWVQQAAVYNLHRTLTFTVQFKTGGASASAAPFDISNINTGRKMWP